MLTRFVRRFATTGAAVATPAETYASFMKKLEAARTAAFVGGGADRIEKQVRQLAVAVGDATLCPVFDSLPRLLGPAGVPIALYKAVHVVLWTIWC